MAGLDCWMVVVGVVDEVVVGVSLDLPEPEPDPGPEEKVVVVGVEVEVEVVCGEVLVAAGVVAVAVGHDRETCVIGSLTGSGSDDARVPGGTFRKVNCRPPWTVTFTVQPSAEASGITARPNTVTTEMTLTAARINFRRLNNCGLLPPARCHARRTS